MKLLKEDLNIEREEVISAIGKVFEYNLSDTLLDATETIIDRALEDIGNGEDTSDAVWQAMDDTLIYTYTQWEVMKEYQSPQDANWDEAWDSYYNDLLRIVEILREKSDEDADENTEEAKEESLGEAYREEADNDSVEELALYIDNDSDIYYSYTIPTIKALAKKLEKGIFDKDLAVKAFKYVADAGAKKYNSEDFETDYTFNPATREEVAKHLLERHMDYIKELANIE